MVDLIESDNHTTVLIATKALAVVCRNSPANQALAIRRGLLAKCIALLSRCDDTYTAKWVILVINALVYENGEVRSHHPPPPPHCRLLPSCIRPHPSTHPPIGCVLYQSVQNYLLCCWACVRAVPPGVDVLAINAHAHGEFQVAHREAHAVGAGETGAVPPIPAGVRAA